MISKELERDEQKGRRRKPSGIGLGEAHVSWISSERSDRMDQVRGFSAQKRTGSGSRCPNSQTTTSPATWKASEPRGSTGKSSNNEADTKLKLSCTSTETSLEKSEQLSLAYHVGTESQPYHLRLSVQNLITIIQLNLYSEAQREPYCSYLVQPSRFERDDILLSLNFYVKRLKNHFRNH
ncbi:hypothetical protein F511_13117 [Dorcoceras hygrometricum]|uniref:Uncharacterized protein n=1 Tax=Dorcoceras hygrometricum TaxID=472368 RepID=A0A2Z7CZK0_9LAMI|nr:hypothetical protein F511_13117 [Dorcoceras hygrometricum]